MPLENCTFSNLERSSSPPKGDTQIDVAEMHALQVQNEQSFKASILRFRQLYFKKNLDVGQFTI